MQVIKLYVEYNYVSIMCCRSDVYFDLSVQLQYICTDAVVNLVLPNHVYVILSTAGCLEGVSACAATGDDLLYSYRIARTVCRLWDENSLEWTSGSCEVRTIRSTALS